MNKFFIILLIINLATDISFSKDFNPTKYEIYEPKISKGSYKPNSLNTKISIEEIEYIFFGDKKSYPIINQPLITFEQSLEKNAVLREIEKKKKNKETYKKRAKKRNIASCLYNRSATEELGKRCSAKVIRAVITYSEKSKVRRPGDIFYLFDAIENLLNYQNREGPNFIEGFVYDPKKKITEKTFCTSQIFIKEGYTRYPFPYCYTFKKSTLKKIKKFQQSNESNEKLLGHSLIRYIKNVRIVSNIREKLGTNNYALIGDMMNSVVGELKKNEISPSLEIRIKLLKKYLLILNNIKTKIESGKLKSTDKEITNLSKTFKNFINLKKDNSELSNKIDQAVKIVSDAHNLVISSVVFSKDNFDEKNFALSSIYFMQFTIDQILSVAPPKYYAETKELSLDLFDEDDLKELEEIVTKITINNNSIKSKKLISSRTIIDEYINTSEILKKLNNIEINSNFDDDITYNSALDIASKEIRDSLGNDIIKDSRKIVQELDLGKISNFTNEISNLASEVASEVASDKSVKETVSSSVLDKKFGNVTLKQLIGASRR